MNVPYYPQGKQVLIKGPWMEHTGARGAYISACLGISYVEKGSLMHFGDIRLGMCCCMYTTLVENPSRNGKASHFSGIVNILQPASQPNLFRGQRHGFWHSRLQQ